MTERTESSVAPRRPFLSDLDPFGRWEPHSLFERLFGDAPSGLTRLAQMSAPAVDVTETDEEYRVHAELPGVSKDDVAVELEQGVLTLRGEKKSQRDESNEKGRHLECSYGAFSRTFTLPKDADPDQISASFKDGVLDISIKKNPESKPTQIAIKS